MTAVLSTGADAQTRGLIVATARAWIGTPYRHRASARQAGTDCLGLLRGIWREVIGPEPEALPAYTADWSEVSRDERLLEAARRHLLPIAIEDAEAGDVLVMRMAHGAPAKHVAILSSGRDAPRSIIHAYSGHAVCETGLGEAWARKVVAAFRFPARSG